MESAPTSALMAHSTMEPPVPDAVSLAGLALQLQSAPAATTT